MASEFWFSPVPYEETYLERVSSTNAKSPKYLHIHILYTLSILNEATASFNPPPARKCLRPVGHNGA